MDNLVEFVAGRRKKWASLVAQPVDNLPYNAGDVGSVPEWGRSPGEGHGNPLQYSCLENPMDRGAWRATVHGVTKCWTWLKWLRIHVKEKKRNAFSIIYIFFENKGDKTVSSLNITSFFFTLTAHNSECLWLSLLFCPLTLQELQLTFFPWTPC